MSEGLLQFNSGENVVGDRNIAEAISVEGDIVFNESYTVIGEILEAKHIHSTYDLNVIADVCAESISVNGNLLIQGSVEAREIICRGTFICTGEVKAEKINLGTYAVAESIVGEELYASDNLFVRTTIDTNTSLEIDGLIVAGEGIMGDGSFNANSAVANDYFEFSGDKNTDVFEISKMEFVKGNIKGKEEIVPDTNLVELIDSFNNIFHENLSEWAQFDEELFVKKYREVVSRIDALHFSNYLLDEIINLSYEREITNFKDYLYILGAKNVFPKELAQYETIEPVLGELLDDATFKIDNMDFTASNEKEFACSLLILCLYQEQMPISMEEGADKIFSSVGLRYSTVERVWRRPAMKNQV